MNFTRLGGDALLVYADSLEAEGDPRGALIALQQRRELEPPGRQARRLYARQLDLLTRHGPQLLESLQGLNISAVSWRLGFIDEVAVTLQTARDFGALLEALNFHALARLTRLSLTFGRDVELGRLWAVLPSTVERLSLKLPHDAEWAVEGMPRVAGLELSGGGSLDFDECALPGAVDLRLDVSFENLNRQALPRLQFLTVSEAAGEVDAQPWLKLVRCEDSGDLWLGDGVTGHRLLREGNEVVRVGFGFAAEHAFVLTDAPEAVIDAALGEHPAQSLSAAIAPVRLSGRALSAVELRGESTGALTLFSRRLGARHRVLEVAASLSNGDALGRAVDAEGARCLAMGPFRERSRVWREAVDQLFGADPGSSSWAEVTTRLDAQTPVTVRGEAGDWPLVTPLPAAEDARELDEFGDAYDEEPRAE